MKLEGVDGADLFGFMVALGLLRLANTAARKAQVRISFDDDYYAMLHWEPVAHQDVAATLHAEALSRGQVLEKEFGEFDSPGKFTPEAIRQLATNESRDVTDWLAGLVCTRGDEDVHETTLCAANGAGHQHLLKSMRDILRLVRPEHIEAALFAPWQKQFVPPKGPKPTLRLDPADERLYALRFSNPTTTPDFTTELGAQALAMFAFPLLPVVPRNSPQRTVSVSSDRQRNKVYFEWSLWAPPAPLSAIRSHLAAGPRDQRAAQSRGAFAAFRAARVSGDKGKLSFSPTEGMWAIRRTVGHSVVSSRSFAPAATFRTKE